MFTMDSLCDRFLKWSHFLVCVQGDSKITLILDDFAVDRQTCKTLSSPSRQ